MENLSVLKLYDYERQPIRRLLRIVGLIQEVMNNNTDVRFENIHFHTLPDERAVKCTFGNHVVIATGRSRRESKNIASMMMLRKLGFIDVATYLSEEQQEILKTNYVRDKWQGVENAPQIDDIDITGIHADEGNILKRLEKVVNEIRKCNFPVNVRYIKRDAKHLPSETFMECVVERHSTIGMGINRLNAKKSAAQEMLLKMGFKKEECFIGEELQEKVMEKYEERNMFNHTRRRLFTEEVKTVDENDP